MTLIVEDGSQVEDANSYVTLAEFRSYAAARGVDVPADDGEAEAMLVKAVDYLESFAARFVGERVSRTQSLSWPRASVTIEGFTWGPTEIPRQVLSAQLALGAEIAQGQDPFNPPAALPVVRERVDTIEVEYANPGAVHKVSATAPSRAIINTLLSHSGLRMIRA